MTGLRIAFDPSFPHDAALAALAAALDVRRDLVAEVVASVSGRSDAVVSSDPDAARVFRAASGSDAPDEAGDLDEAQARSRLAAAYGASDWIAAAPSLDRLTRPEARPGDTELIRLAEAAVGLGRWRLALDLVDRLKPGKHAGLAGVVRTRARLGLGDVEGAWRALLETDVTSRAPRAIALAETMIALLGDVDRAAALARETPDDAGAVARVALARSLQGRGRVAEARGLLRRIWRGDLDPGVRIVVLETRCATAPGGWPAKTQSLWAERVVRLATTGRGRAAEAVARLVDCRWHRPAWRVLVETGCDPDPRTLTALALGLVWEGALEEPAALLARLKALGVKNPQTDALERHVTALATIAGGRPSPDGPRPATRLLLEALPAPAAVRSRRSEARRICHVATSFSVGGTERQLSLIARGLAGRRPDLRQDILMSGTPGGPLRPDEFPETRGRIFLRGVRGLDHGPTSPPGRDPLTGRAARLQRIEAYRRIFEADEPDAVMVWKPEVTALIGAVLAGVPRVVLRNGSVAPTKRHWMREHQAAIGDYVAEGFRWLAPRPTLRFVTNSAAALDELVAELHWPRDRSSVLYNAMDLGRFRIDRSRAVSRARLGLPEAATIVGGCFRISPEKRPLLWLDAAEACLASPAGFDLVFAIAGDGPLTDVVAARIAERGLGGRIVLLGQLDAEIADFHNAIDVLLHAAAFEGLPNAVIEAQANGVPAVAGRAGGTAEAFQPGVTGELVEDMNAAGFAAGVLRAVERLPDYRARRNAFDAFVAERFGLRSCIDRLEDLLGLAD